MLLPLLTSLLHPSAPAWLRAKFATALSLLPLRENGALQVINFIAASYPAPVLDPVNGGQNSSHGLVLPLDALAQMSKLLSSVPASMTPETYFTTLAPQLWGLLDAKDDPEMRKAAGYIIGSGILGKRALGAPDKIGWKLFAQPLLKAFNPDYKAQSQARITLTDEESLATALRRLTAIVTSHPSPGLTRRLLWSVILPLWGLSSYSKRGIFSPSWADTSSNLLKAFFRHCAQTEHYLLIANNLLWDGPDHWTFGSGNRGGIQIRGREVEKEDPFNVIQSMTHVDASIKNYLDLLMSSGVEHDIIAAVFLATTRRWLLPEENSGNEDVLGTVRESDPFKTLVSAKLAQAILDQFKDQIVKEPSKLVELVEQLLSEYLKQRTTDRGDIFTSDIPDSKKLRNLISESQSPKYQDSMVEDALNEESTDIAVVALSLLDTIISIDSMTTKPVIRVSLSKLLPLLDALHSSSEMARESSISTLAGNLARVIRKPASTSDESYSARTTSVVSNDQYLYNEALENLSSELAPIRVEGLAILQELIASQSPKVSIPAITLLFIRNVLTDPDSFVHLAGIRTLVMLAAQDARLVTRLLADVFIDPKEEEGNGLDVRLAVGETLASIVQAMASDYDPDNSKYGEAAGWKIRGKTETRIRCDYATKLAVLRLVVLAVLRVGGRRGERVKSKQTRERKAALAGKKQKEAQDAWGGEVPQLEEEEEDGNGDDDDQDGNGKGANQETAALLQTILHGWENTGLEEDVRLRASALSILGQVLELHCTALDTGLLLSGVDLALQIIGSQTEARPERAIVRRAAVLALAMLVCGVDRAYEGSSESQNYQDQKRNDTVVQSVGWQSLETKLRWTSEMDEDEIVKGHARAAMDELEAWRMKRVLGLDGNGGKMKVGSTDMLGTNRTLDGGGSITLAGLNVDPEIRDDDKKNDVKNSNGRMARRRMIEEIE